MRAKRYKTLPVTNMYLRTWPELNAFLMSTTNIDLCESLLQQELDGRARSNFIKRVAARISKLRRGVYKEQINKVINEGKKENETSSD